MKPTFKRSNFILKNSKASGSGCSIYIYIDSSNRIVFHENRSLYKKGDRNSITSQCNDKTRDIGFSPTTISKARERGLGFHQEHSFSTSYLITHRHDRHPGVFGIDHKIAVTSVLQMFWARSYKFTS